MQRKHNKHTFTSSSTSTQHALQSNDQEQSDIKHSLQSSLDSVDHSLELVEQAKLIGNETGEKLQHQGEQLKHIQNTVDDIAVEQKKSKRHLSAIDSLLGFFVNKVKRAPKRQDNVKKVDEKLADEAKERESLKLETPYFYKQQYLHLDSLDEEDKAKLKKIDKRLDQIESGVDDLKNISLALGDELEEHIQRLDVLAKTTGKAGYEMDQLTNEAKRITGKSFI